MSETIPSAPPIEKKVSLKEWQKIHSEELENPSELEKLFISGEYDTAVASTKLALDCQNNIFEWAEGRLKEIGRKHTAGTPFDNEDKLFFGDPQLARDEFVAAYDELPALQKLIRAYKISKHNLDERQATTLVGTLVLMQNLIRHELLNGAFQPANTQWQNWSRNLERNVSHVPSDPSPKNVRPYLPTL